MLGAPSSTRHAASVGLFKDSFGAFRGCFSVYIGISTALHAKLYAVMVAVEHAHSVGWLRMWLECDSEYQN